MLSFNVTRIQKIKDYIKCLINKHAFTHYSLEGEDIVLGRIFENKRQGFYVDVGAHHPHRFSNTYLFYKKGWRGINIDANPGSMAIFKKFRRHDLNLEEAISSNPTPATFYIFSDGALNTLDSVLAEKVIREGKYKLQKKVTIIPSTLKDILSKHLPSNTKIDFLTIDIEGRDVDALRSNDWNRFRPHIIIIEQFNFDLENPLDNEAYKFLKEQNYRLISKTVTSLIFEDKTGPSN